VIGAATNATATQPPIRIHFRNVDVSDRSYILDSWRLGWRNSETCRRMKGNEYTVLWRDVVRDGVLAQDDTQILVGCSQVDHAWIWSWLCYTPGPIPTVHYAVVRPYVDTRDGGTTELRRLGIFTRMLAAAGVRHELAYTFRPTERTQFGKKPLGLERGLLDAAKRDGITAVYRPIVEGFLKPRRQER
jgi:hypothetical protein